MAMLMLVGPIFLVLLCINLILTLREVIGFIDIRKPDEEEDQPRADGR